MDFGASPFECLVKGCKHQFTDLFFYARHLTQHQIPINIMYLKFKNRMDFKNWKLAEEYANNCMFTQSFVSDSLFCCHRNAYISTEINKDDQNLINKHAEDERLFKIKSPCPSHMKYEVIDEEHHVIYVRTHYGYCSELSHIAISDETAKKVKALSENGCHDRLIMEKVRKEMRDKSHTDSLITTRNIAEILKR